MAGAFTRAKRQQIKLRMALAGISGSGKTYTSLALASVLAGGEPFAVIDTEHGSSDRYADLFTFDRLNLTAPYTPERYIEAIHDAERAGYAVLVIDSLTHEWTGAGGVLAEVDRIAQVKYRGNSFQAWGDMTPRHNALIEAITGAGAHILATIRSKPEYAVETVNGKATPKKLGMQAVQRDGFEYEFDIFGEMDAANVLTVTKSRAVSLAGQVIARPGEELGRALLAWTATGERAPGPTPEVAPASTPKANEHAPSNGKAASVTDPATEQQYNAITKLCVALGKPDLGLMMSREDAKHLIAQLTTEFNATRDGAKANNGKMPAPAAPTVAQLYKRMHDLGVRTVRHADIWAKDACDKTWEQIGESDAPKLAAYIAKKAAEKQAAEAKIAAAQGTAAREGRRADEPPDFPEEIDLSDPEPVEGDATDLRTLPTGAPGN